MTEDERKPAASTDINQPLLTLKAVDWRVVDEADEDLPEIQKQPWTLVVKPGSYSGIYVEAHAPDGTIRAVDFEVDEGNLVLRVFDDASQDPSSRITIGEPVVAPSNNTPKP